MDTGLTALERLVDTITKISKDASNEIGRLPHNEAAIRTIFVHFRGYYAKVYYLAKYICDEEQYSIQSVEEGKVEDIQDFLGEVVDKAENCKKDLETLIEYLETERQTLLQQDGKVKERKKDAQSTTTIGKVIVIFGVALCVACIIVILIASKNELIKALCFVVLVVGLAIISAGAFVAIKGHSTKSNNQDEEQEHYRIVFAIEQLKSFVKQSESKLHTDNIHLKSAINQHHQQQLKGNRPTKSSLIQYIKEVTESARGLKEYCQEFKDASSLEHFISYHTSNNLHNPN